MLIVIIICTILNVLVTVIPLSKNTHWTVRGLDFPRLQFLTFSFALIIAIISILDLHLILNLILLSATVLCAFYQMWWILPYTPLWPKEVESCIKNDSDRSISIITSNVLTPNRNSAALIKLVHENQPDILITLESDLWWQEQLQVLESEMPYTVKCPLDNLYGMHLYSRLPLHDAELSFLVEDGVPSIHTSIELRSGEQIRAHFVHPSPPSPTENEESKERDAELIIIAQSVAQSDQPIIVTGDLNDVAWSSTTRLFRKTSSLLDPRVGRGMFNTFHAKIPFLRWPLDHLFHSKHFTLCSIKRLPSIGSDHFPLYSMLTLNPNRNENQEGLNEESGDRERANEIADKKKVNKSDVPTSTTISG